LSPTNVSGEKENGWAQFKNASGISDKERVWGAGRGVGGWGWSVGKNRDVRLGPSRKAGRVCVIDDSRKTTNKRLAKKEGAGETRRRQKPS